MYIKIILAFSLMFVTFPVGIFSKDQVAVEFLEPGKFQPPFCTHQTEYKNSTAICSFNNAR